MTEIKQDSFTHSFFSLKYETRFMPFDYILPELASDNVIIGAAVVDVNDSVESRNPYEYEKIGIQKQTGYKHYFSYIFCNCCSGTFEGR